MFLIGYARVSTNDQDTAAESVALKAACCERIFREEASGGRWERREFDDRTRAVLKLASLAQAENKHPHEISGGMKQRVGIALALVMQPH